MRLPVYKQVWWWGGAGLVLALALWRLGNVMTPFLLGAGIAYVLDPIADRLERSGLRRTWAVTLITAIAGLAFVLVMLLVLPVIVRQVTQAMEGAPAMFERAQALAADRFPKLLPEGGTVRTAMNNIGAGISERGGELLGTVLSSVGNFLAVMALLVIVPVVAFYLLLDWDHMVARVDELLPRDHAPSLRRIAGEIDDTLSGFLRGQGLVTLILGTFYAVSLFAIGLPFGLVIGIMAAVLSIIPYVGVFVGGVTAIGVALVHFWGQPAWIGAVAGIFALGQLVEGNYLQPKIIGGHVGLHPVWLMIALAVFGSLFGFVGLIVAVPLAAMVGVVARFLAARYKESALYTGREVPPPPPQPTLIELVPRGTVASARQQAERAKAVAVAEVRIEEARRDALRAAEETVKKEGAHAARATAVAHPEAALAEPDGHPEVIAVEVEPEVLPIEILELGEDALPADEDAGGERRPRPGRRGGGEEGAGRSGSGLEEGEAGAERGQLGTGLDSRGPEGARPAEADRADTDDAGRRQADGGIDARQPGAGAGEGDRTGRLAAPPDAAEPGASPRAATWPQGAVAGIPGPGTG